MIMNAHVVDYLRARCQAAAARGDYVMQWFYYTWEKLEEDPHWRAN